MREAEELAASWHRLMVEFVNQRWFLWLLRHLGMELKPQYRRAA